MAQFSPDGSKVLTTAWDNTTRIWDSKNGKELVRLVGTIALFSPDGKKIATGLSWDKQAHLWDAETGRELKKLPGDTAEVSMLKFSPDGKSLLTASAGGSKVRIWNVESGKELARFTGRYADFSPDGKALLIVEEAGTIFDTPIADAYIKLVYTDKFQLVKEANGLLGGREFIQKEREFFYIGD